MRIVNYLRDGRSGVGVVDEDRIIPLAGLDAIGAGVGSAEIHAAARLEDDAFPLAEAHLLPASPQPAKVFCVGLNYLEHVEETKRELPAYPVLFPKYASSLIGAHDPIAIPAESEQVDYEAELAVVIGTGGRRIAEADAMNHVLGFAVANDVTMRDFQYKTHQWLQGKAWDGATPIGPEVATPDEFDWTSAGIRTFVNDQLVQDSDLTMLIFSIPRLIATVSVFTRLEPGDVILTGTPGGVGFRRDPQLFLQPGDRVVVEIDGLGRIDSECVREA
ncbi:fumarylacetoacetate hydrolase family protein [Microbacterium allomyrinae]|uniref:Fumarylacetoacetate hydrolase family protein n=1 Tax=Microbacterium allomyrinae TaxID=2830666 RepID=A0A9X1LWZ5_9MICO|nr:fumarylacetoacetate hydrolase family protein [Microbacterium allomyrinae]MCC2033246.1 fumarylacetoacetate hydrolase family protein [Microbacterium allomyrinae]